ncbi:MAG: choline dehydrogenase-like flavoprotein, partial [Myxococcota bacterium]
VREAIGYLPPPPPGAPERNRWDGQVVDARTLAGDETLEADVIIVGTGAGGAPMAKALAARGHAVLMFEEGGHFTRADFDGNALRAQRRMFRGGGATIAWGNGLFPVLSGQTVGGSTTVNSGTCYRTTDRRLRQWALESGLSELDAGSLDPYFERVERMLQVTRAADETLGGCARVIARGAEALGLRHAPLDRNAPECDGQGVCCFGCPTDAKRSTNVSYMPAALKAGATVYHNAVVNRVLTEGGRAVGVVATAGGRRITARAAVVVLSGGAIGTPALLLQNRLANSSGQVGRQLTVHPACYGWARFDEDIRGWSAIPQGYAIEEYADLGIRFEGAFVPPDLAVASLAQLGRDWTDIAENLHRMACFGFMITDTSRGRVWLGPRGAPQMSYHVNDHDRRQMIRGHAILARVYQAAGAEMVYPGVRKPFDRLRTEADVARFERDAGANMPALDIDITAYHPLGSCRMGADPNRFVTSGTGETHDVQNLFICDGSAVPGPLGVNPQVTIMALSERNAQFVERRVEQFYAAARPNREAPLRTSPAPVEFAETMGGAMRLADGRLVDVEFTVSATFEASTGRGATFTLGGIMRFPTLAEAAACEGTLQMNPTQRTATLVYDLEFDGDDGVRYALHGEKHTRSLKLLTGMTTLHTTATNAGQFVASGTLTFDMKTLPHFLSTWRIAMNAA